MMVFILKSLKNKNCFLILGACASVFVLCYFVQFSDVFSSKIDINVRQYKDSYKLEKVSNIIKSDKRHKRRKLRHPTDLNVNAQQYEKDNKFDKPVDFPSNPHQYNRGDHHTNSSINAQQYEKGVKFSNTANFPINAHQYKKDDKLNHLTDLNVNARQYEKGDKIDKLTNFSINAHPQYKNDKLNHPTDFSVNVHPYENSDKLDHPADVSINAHHYENGQKSDYPNVLQSSDTSNSGKGFILVSRYFEQQIGAAMNLLSLAKWAKTVGAFPVEPFVSKSSLHNFVSEDVLGKSLHFHDYFDIELWNKMCLNVSAMPLIPWDTFVAHNSGNFVLVLDEGKETSKPALVNDEIMNEVACKEDFQRYERKIRYYITQTLNLSMTIVRRVCISFNKRHSISINDFTKIVYGDFNPTNVVVWFQIWKGILGHLRVRITEPEYARNPTETFTMLQNSKRIHDDSAKYVKNVLKSDFGKYVAISFRSVQKAKSYVEGNKEVPMDVFHSCISQLHKTVDFINSTGMVFLAQDLGRFGDVKDNKFFTDDMITTIENELFQSLYNGKLTVEEWEQQFINVTGGITDSGYIAAMQSEILEGSGCIIMFGGGSNFQRNVLYRYKQIHANNGTCVHTVCYDP